MKATELIKTLTASVSAYGEGLEVSIEDDSGNSEEIKNIKIEIMSSKIVLTAVAP